MRLRLAPEWFFLLVIAADQAVKSAGHTFLEAGERLQLFPGFNLALTDAPLVEGAPERLRLLVLGLLAVLVLVRLEVRDRRAGPLAYPAILVVAGGMASAAVDLVFLREHVLAFAVSVAPTGLLLTFADLVIIAGVALFALDLFRRRRLLGGPVAELQRPTSTSVDLARLTPGIDNVHIDVQLSPRFVATARSLVVGLLTPQVWQAPWAETHQTTTHRAGESFAASYAQLIETAVHRAKQQQLTVLVSLAQLAAVKFILEEVTSQFDHLLHEYRTTLDYNPPSSDTGARTYQHLVNLRRRRHAICEHTAQTLFQQIERVERDSLGPLKESLLGEAIGLPPAMLVNPMIHVENPLDDEFLMEHYVLMGHRAEDPTNPKRLERLLRSALGCADTRDEDQGAKDESFLAGTWAGRLIARKQSDARGDETTEPEVDDCSWLDAPDNADVLLDVASYAQQRKQARQRGDRETARRLRRHLRFQRRLLAQLDRLLRAEGVMSQVLAAYEVPELWDAMEVPINPRAIQRYISSPRGRAEVAPRLKRLARRNGRTVSLEALDLAARRTAQASRQQRYEAIRRFMKDFLRYRHDHQQAGRLQAWFERIRLLDDANELRLSRTNRSLYEFHTPQDSQESKPPDIRGHAIIKADIRGSTDVVRHLVQRGLNPATHFDINFFAPLKSLIELYGAEKVFIEGDAVILAIVEQDTDASPKLAVARACGLARSILEVVSVHNTAASKYGLPELELGIGIAYESAAPAYLFDEDHPVMISPAIARADRLSSCSSYLRKQQEPGRGRRVRVYRPAAEHASLDPKGTTQLRYNVNGIELEPDAFHKLTSEVHLHSARFRARGNKPPVRFYLGRYPDVRGVMRQLVVREGQVKQLDENLAAERTEELYYEVVVDARTLERVVARAGSSATGGDDA